MTLEILICTIDDGIQRALRVPCKQPIDHVVYLISWQHSRDASHSVPIDYVERADVRIVECEGRGLAKNRNHALRYAQGDVCLFSDDDTRYCPEYFERIKHAFTASPDADIISFQAVNREHVPIKPYPRKPFDYARTPRGMYYSSVELAFRRHTQLPRFDERFGIGSPHLGCGEEEVWLHEAYRRGLHIIYSPVVVVETDSNTSGQRFATDQRIRRAKGAVLYMMHGYLSALLRCFKYAITQQGISFLVAWKDMLWGIHYIKNESKKY